MFFCFSKKPSNPTAVGGGDSFTTQERVTHLLALEGFRFFFGGEEQKIHGAKPHKQQTNKN